MIGIEIKMPVAFLADPGEDPGRADPAFQGDRVRTTVLDLEQFAPICD